MRAGGVDTEVERLLGEPPPLRSGTEPSRQSMNHKESSQAHVMAALLAAMVPLTSGAVLELEGSAADPPTISFGSNPNRFDCTASTAGLSCDANFSTHVISAHDVRVLGSDMSLADVIAKVSTLENEVLALRQQVDSLTPPPAPPGLPPDPLAPPAPPPYTGLSGYSTVGVGDCEAPGNVNPHSIRYDAKTLAECQTLCYGHAVCIGVDWRRWHSATTGYCYLQVSHGSAIRANFPAYAAVSEGSGPYTPIIVSSTGIRRDPPEHCYRRDGIWAGQPTR